VHPIKLGGTGNEAHPGSKNEENGLLPGLIIKIGQRSITKRKRREGRIEKQDNSSGITVAAGSAWRNSRNTSPSVLKKKKG